MTDAQSEIAREIERPADVCSICERVLEPGEGLYSCAECGADVCSECSLKASTGGVVCVECCERHEVWDKYDVVED